MPHIHIVFDTTGFNDIDDIRAQNINGIVGHTLANWLVGQLLNRGYETSEIWDEDHGWDFDVQRDTSTYLCACSVIVDEQMPHEGHVTIYKKRSLVDWILGRNRYSKSDELVTNVTSLIQGRDDVSKFEVEA